MTRTLTVAIVGDHEPSYTSHAKTDEALQHASTQLGVAIEPRWIHTTGLDADTAALDDADAVLGAPGGPFASIDGMLAGLRHGRENGVPTLGTCGGCQHMMLEFARNALGVADAEHAEYDPTVEDPFVAPLACSLVGRVGTVALDRDARVRAIYGTDTTTEQYFCSYGLNPRYEALVDDAGFRVVGRDAEDGTVRVLELDDHPFYVATLFVPQVNSTPERPHPLITSLLTAARERAPVTA